MTELGNNLNCVCLNQNMFALAHGIGQYVLLQVHIILTVTLFICIYLSNVL